MSNGTRPPKLIFDITSLACWYGPAVGISRAEGNFARWARSNRTDVQFAFFDTERSELREIKPQWIDAILTGAATVDLWGVPGSNPTRRHKSDRISRAIRPLVLSLLRPKKWTMTALERIRLTTESARLRALTTRLQKFLMSEKYRRQMMTTKGTRRALIPYSFFVGARLALTPGDIVFNAGSGWSNLNIDAIRERKQRDGFRLTVLCHDIIPLQFPQFYKAPDVEEFRKYFHSVFPTADLIVFTSRRIEADARAFCAANGLTMRATAICPLGANAVREISNMGIPPAGLECGRYALFVSTIEPRKGHRLLYNVWKRLLAEGIPQATGFKLVFLGRPGWMVDELLHELHTDPALGDTLRIISYAEDDVLAPLYENAAFCLYPSTYEGYGLPIAEAFSFGKAVIASTGGATPELVGEFSPCLDPKDEGAWYRLLREWIEDPSARAPYEKALGERYRPLTWDEASARLFATLDEQFSRPR